MSLHPDFRAWSGDEDDPFPLTRHERALRQLQLQESCDHPRLAQMPGLIGDGDCLICGASRLRQRQIREDGRR